ncbi:hypothetical protein SAMN05444920_121189 [Nonomuraea solani]|uniref:Uncharacterized protein n=1 Tax=Nonomuraea solani TaxID=1144553 RepID=A0A1H6EXA8_9ACTN|nr:hypothetical protein [Nonomuraea solani]SEH01741.1 hypothetical protein SAMN05444920_121189 [Nonomuraea solani]
MNRVVKTAVAVTAFGLAAAALAVPAQAEVRNNTARYAPIDGPAGTTAASSPLGGLLGGLVGGGLLNGVLGASKPKAGAHPGMTEAERDAAVENQEEQVGSANAAEDVTRQGGPLPELSPIIGGMPLGGGGLTESLPILGGAARMAQPATPSVKAGKQSETQPKAIGMNTFGGATGMLESSVGGAMGTLSTTNLLPGTGTSVTDTSSATAKTMNATTRGVETLSADTAIFGVTQATRRALPGATSGELSPVIGQVAPAEMAPVAEALPGTSQAASMDELAPVIDQASGFVAVSGKKATGRYSDVITALGWSTDALTSSVRNSWARD